MSLLLLLRNHEDGATPPAPAPSPVATSVRPLPFPRTGGTGRTVRIEMVADLGTIHAQTSPRIELADEDIIELL